MAVADLGGRPGGGGLDDHAGAPASRPSCWRAPVDGPAVGPRGVTGRQRGGGSNDGRPAGGGVAAGRPAAVLRTVMQQTNTAPGVVLASEPSAPVLSAPRWRQPDMTHVAVPDRVRRISSGPARHRTRSGCRPECWCGWASTWCDAYATADEVAQDHREIAAGPATDLDATLSGLLDLQDDLADTVIWLAENWSSDLPVPHASPRRSTPTTVSAWPASGCWSTARRATNAGPGRPTRCPDRGRRGARPGGRHYQRAVRDLRPSRHRGVHLRVGDGP